MKNLAFVAAMLASTAALASSPGVVSQVYSGGGANNQNDPRPCVFFQTSDAQWYAIPQSDGNYATEKDTLFAARLSGNVLTFGAGPGIAECSSLPRAFGLSF